MFRPLLKRANAWLTRLVAFPGDDEEMLVAKKIWLSTVLVINLVSLISSFWWLYGMGLRTMFIFQLFYTGYFAILVALFLRVKRYYDWFAIATAVFHVLFSFIGVCVEGGIMSSAGLIFVGWGGGPLTLLLIQKNKRWATPVLILFIITVVAEGILQPYLSPDPDYSADEILINFTVFFLVITVAIFFMLRYFINETAKNKREEKERMQELADMKTRFYTNITHEFRTPLSVILGMAEQIEAKPAEYFHNGLSLIRQNGKRLLHLVNQMLDLAKLESGAMPAHYIRSDVVPYLLYMIEPYQRLAMLKGKDVRFVHSPEHIELDFDAEKIDSLLGNLLSNAVKFSPKGSEILVSVEVSENGLPEEGGWFSLYTDMLPGKKWCISVADSGTGIPAQELHYIFDRFYQVKRDNETELSSYTGGTGIGLAVVKQLVRLLKGNLLVKSEIGKGTEFRVYLPLSGTAPPATATSLPFVVQSDIEFEEELQLIAKPLNGERLQVLVVEDNPGVVLYLKSILEPEYRIGVAVDGNEGIEMAVAAIPDIIISDVMMPRKDGFELCKTLKNDMRTSHIPIILLTAKADIESKLAGLELGADAYMSKPFNSHELRTRVRKLIEMRQKLREKYRTIPLEPSPTSTPPNLDEAFFNQIHKILESRSGDEDFHSDQLCHLLGISRTQLFRKLKATTGASASQIIRSYRLNKARNLLDNPKLTISEVAYDVGFKDPAYFTRAFAREFGYTPSELRK